MANIIEGIDASASVSTAYQLGVGQTARGTVSAAGDHDWFRVDLVAGQTYTFAMTGTGAVNLNDPYLRLYNPDGSTLAGSNDNALPNSNAVFTYTAATSGTYYLDAGSATSGTGQYGIAATLGTRASFDGDMISGVLDSHATWAPARGAGVVVTYGFRDTYSGSETNFSHVGAAQQAAVRTALQFYSEISGVVFQEVNPGGYTDNATILISDYSANDGAGAYAYYPGSTAAASASGDLWLNTSVSTQAGSLGFGTYSLFAIMHEFGHALGLSHPGTYNAAVGVSITYAANAQFVQDSNQYSIMSYFGASNTGGSQGGYADTPMLYDVAALQAMYGANMTTRTGDTVYGFGTNAGALYDFAINTAPALTIWDAGGTDTLDASAYASNQTISLNAGDFSSIGGLINNISIAYGAVIENATGGFGADTIYGNSANNVLRGGGGSDALYGNIGNDTLNGGAGTNVLSGGGGYDRASYSVASSSASITHNADGTVTITALGINDTLSSVEVANFTDGSVALRTATAGDYLGIGTSDILLRNAANGDTGFYQYSTAGVSLGWTSVGGSNTAYGIVGEGDFNGDGTSDILFRNANTGDTGFYRMLNGTLQGWNGLGGTSLAYSVSGIGDFNGDGTSDILFRNNASGDTGFYQMSNGVSQGWHALGGSSTAYGVIGVGDFDGDGTSDILFRNASTGDTGFYRMSNGVNLGWVGIGASSSAYSVVGIGDFNGDGTSDILFRSGTTGDTGFYQMTHGVLEGWHRIGGSSAAYLVVGTGDYNGDGTSDVLFRNGTNGDMGYYQMHAGTLEGWHAIGGTSTAYTVWNDGGLNGGGIAPAGVAPAPIPTPDHWA